MYRFLLFEPQYVHEEVTEEARADLNRRDNVGKGRGEVLAATRDTLNIQAAGCASLVSFSPNVSDIKVLSRALAGYKIIISNHRIQSFEVRRTATTDTGVSTLGRAEVTEATATTIAKSLVSNCMLEVDIMIFG